MWISNCFCRNWRPQSFYGESFVNIVKYLENDDIIHQTFSVCLSDSLQQIWRFKVNKDRKMGYRLDLGSRYLQTDLLCLSCLQQGDIRVCVFDLCETVSPVLCVSEVKGEGLERLCFCWGSHWGCRWLHKGKKIYCCSFVFSRACTHTHTFTHIVNDFSSCLLFDPLLSLSSVHSNGREEQREMKRWRGRQFLSSPLFRPSKDTLVCPKWDLSWSAEQGKLQGFCSSVCLCVRSFMSTVWTVYSRLETDAGLGVDFLHTHLTLKRPTCSQHG